MPPTGGSWINPKSLWSLSHVAWAKVEDGTGVVMTTAAPGAIMTAGAMITVPDVIMIAGVMIIVRGVTIVTALGLVPAPRLGIGMIVVGLVLAVRMIGTVLPRLIGGIVAVLEGMMIGGSVMGVLEDVGTALGDMERRVGRYLLFSCTMIITAWTWRFEGGMRCSFDCMVLLAEVIWIF